MAMGAKVVSAHAPSTTVTHHGVTPHGGQQVASQADCA